MRAPARAPPDMTKAPGPHLCGRDLAASSALATRHAQDRHAPSAATPSAISSGTSSSRGGSRPTRSASSAGSTRRWSPGSSRGSATCGSRRWTGSRRPWGCGWSRSAGPGGRPGRRGPPPRRRCDPLPRDRSTPPDRPRRRGVGPPALAPTRPVSTDAGSGSTPCAAPEAMAIVAPTGGAHRGRGADRARTPDGPRVGRTKDVSG
jgi:hypothetical protein